MNVNLAKLLALPVDRAARGLLGWRLRSDVDGLPTEVVLNEVEAYGGLDDPASHAFRGETPRNASMFLGAGTLYVYRSYGIHWCANVVTGTPADGQAILLRGGEPAGGVETITRRRGRGGHLTDGPGKLAQALGITGDLDGTSLIDGPVVLLPGEGIVSATATTRIGITRATDRRWRFKAETFES